MSNKKYTEEELKNMIPVFHLKPMSSSRVKCNLSMYAKTEERIFDEQLDVDTPAEVYEKIGKNTILYGVVNNYVIVGKYCSCNIPGNYLIKNSTLPIYYISMIYNRQFITGCLFNVFLYFTLDEETQKRLDDPKKYYKSLMDGKFTIKCVPIDGYDEFISKLKKYMEDEIMLKHYEEFENADEDTQEQIMLKVTDEINNKMEKYITFFNTIEYEKFPSLKNAYETLNSICITETMNELMEYGLLIREKERIQEKCPDLSYEKPKNVINLQEIKNNPEKLREIMATRTDKDYE